MSQFQLEAERPVPQTKIMPGKVEQVNPILSQEPSLVKMDIVPPKSVTAMTVGTHNISSQYFLSFA